MACTSRSSFESTGQQELGRGRCNTISLPNERILSMKEETGKGQGGKKGREIRIKEEGGEGWR